MTSNNKDLRIDLAELLPVDTNTNTFFNKLPEYGIRIKVQLDVNNLLYTYVTVTRTSKYCHVADEEGNTIMTILGNSSTITTDKHVELAFCLQLAQFEML